MLLTKDKLSARLSSPRAQPFRLMEDRLAVQIGLTLAALSILLIVTYIATNLIYNPAERTNITEIKILNFFDLSLENSLSEIFNHGMLFVSAVLFLGASYETHARTPFFLSMFMGFAWLDDSAHYHERLGGFIADSLRLPTAFGLRPQDLGELLAWGLAAAMFLVLAFWAYTGRRHGDGTVFRMIMKPIIALIVCGVFFDMLHILIDAPGSDVFFIVLEDGGEMLAIAAAVAVSMAVLRNSGRIYNLPQSDDRDME